MRAELVAMTDGAADDAPQHVAAAFVRRQHTVNDKERRSTNVISHDIQ